VEREALLHQMESIVCKEEKVPLNAFYKDNQDFQEEIKKMVNQNFQESAPLKKS